MYGRTDKMEFAPLTNFVVVVVVVMIIIKG